MVLFAIPYAVYYLSAWALPVVSGKFPHWWILLVLLIWSCETIPPLMSPLPMTLYFYDFGECEDRPIGFAGVV